MNALITFFRPFVEIVAHRGGPEQLPPSRFLLGLVIAMHIGVYMVGMYLIEGSSQRTVGMPIVDAVAQGAFFGVLLSSMGHANRLLQTLTAAYGADALLNLLSVPIAIAIDAASADGVSSPVASLLWLAGIGVLLWSLGVKGHILHRAIGLPYAVGVAIALAFAVALIAFDQSVFGT